MSYTSYPPASLSHSQTSRIVKTPRKLHTAGLPSAYGEQKYTVPTGPNWAHSSGSVRPIRFDFGRALDEDVAREDETCASSQEYYMRKSQPPKVIPVPEPRPTYVTDTRYLYPTQKANLAFNFDRATRSDIDNMNTALPFGRPPSSQCERKIVTKRCTNNKAGYPQCYSSAPTSSPRNSTLTPRSQNYGGHDRATTIGKR